VPARLFRHGVVAKERRRVALDEAQRRPQLVRDGGDQLGLDPLRLPLSLHVGYLFRKPGVLDRDRQLIGDRGECPALRPAGGL